MPRLRSRKGQLLLAHLVLRHGREVSRDRLCETLWPESLSEQARLSLRQSLVDLRKALGEAADHIETIGANSLRFRAEGADVDVVTFDQIAGLSNPTIDEIEAACACYRAPLLEDAREEWILPEREVRAEAFVALLRKRAEAALAAGDGETAIRCLRRGVAANPLNEGTHRLLMRTLADQGHVPESLEVYRRLRAFLRDELGTEPDEQTVAAYRHLRERVQERHRRSAEATSSESAPASAGRARVPRALTSLVGRAYEEASVSSLIFANRLVTLTGLGGMGKTRLAMEIAGQAEFPEVAFVSLAHLQPPQTVAGHLRWALDLNDAQPLEERIGAKPFLLVLDNCESWADEVSSLVLELVEACPGLRVLATSRTPLGVVGEVVVPLRPLATPQESMPLEEVAATPACALMLERMGLSPWRKITDRDVRLAAEISRRLEGIPLAIELVAAQSRTLPLDDILARLDQPMALLRSSERGRPSRHLTMEDAIRGSYELLGEEVQAFLRALGIFVGGFTLEAAEAVWPSGDALMCLSRLIDASFVYVTESEEGVPRYGMLETIRAFTLDRLREAGEFEAVRQRHFDEFLRLANQARPLLMGAEQMRWIRRLDAELGNFRFALGACGSNQQFLDLINAIFFYWHLTSKTEEAGRWFAEAFRRTEGVSDSAVARMYSGAGTMAWHRMDLDYANDLLSKAIVLARSSGDKAVLFSALNAHGIVLRMLGQFERAYEETLESVSYIRETNDPARLARGLANLGRAASAWGRLDEAVTIFRESLDLFRQVGDERDYAHTEQSLAWCVGEQGQAEEARRLHLNAIETLARLDDPFRLAWSFCTLGVLCLKTGDPVRGAQLFGTVRALERRYRFEVLDERYVADHLRLESFRAALGGAEFERVMAETYDWTHAQGVALAREICAP